MSVEAELAVPFESVAPNRSAPWFWQSFWRRLLNAMRQSRQRQANRFIVEFARNHPEYRDVLRAEYGRRAPDRVA